MIIHVHVIILYYQFEMKNQYVMKKLHLKKKKMIKNTND